MDVLDELLKEKDQLKNKTQTLINEVVGSKKIFLKEAVNTCGKTGIIKIKMVEKDKLTLINGNAFSFKLTSVETLLNVLVALNKQLEIWK